MNEETLKEKDLPIKNNENEKVTISSTKLKLNQHKSYSFSDSKSKHKVSEMERKEKRIENHGRFNLKITQANQTLENLLETCNQLLSKSNNISNIIEVEQNNKDEHHLESNDDIKKENHFSKHVNDEAKQEIKQQDNINCVKDEIIDEELNNYIAEKFEEKESSYKEDFEEYIDESKEKKVNLSFHFPILNFKGTNV